MIGGAAAQDSSDVAVPVAAVSPPSMGMSLRVVNPPRGHEQRGHGADFVWCARTLRCRALDHGAISAR